MKLQEITADQEETVSLDDLKHQIDEKFEKMVEEHKIECDQDGWCHKPHPVFKAIKLGSQPQGYRGTKLSAIDSQQEEYRGTKLSAISSKQEEYKGTKLSEMNPKPSQNLLTQE